jgi:L-rhamnose-H+ transport protein
MAVFHYAASALFAFAAFKLGSIGNTVGYAIFNNACVATAIISGIVTKEWVKASSKARGFLYMGLACMIIGIIIIAIGNGL